MSIAVRLATMADVPALNVLIPKSVRAHSAPLYSPAQIEAAIRHVFGVDTQLVADGTYLVAYEGDAGAEIIVGCGGWSRHRTLYGGDQRPMTGAVTPTAGGHAAALLDPAVDAARIRAFFVAPGHGRRGIGRRLFEACQRAAHAAGFSHLELMATLPGVPLYAALGFRQGERVTDILPDGTAIEFVRMARAIGADVGGASE